MGIMSKRTQYFSTFSLSLLILLGVANVSLFHFRVDLTQKGTYTVTSVTKSLFQEFDGSILITYYVSDPLLHRSPLPLRIAEQLRAFAEALPGRVDLRISDPTLTGETRIIRQIGLKTNAEGFFSGITLEYRDELEVIPWILEPANVEYLLATHIQRITNPQKRRVGILKGKTGVDQGEDVLPILSGVGFSPILIDSETLFTVPTILVLHGERLSAEWGNKLEDALDRGQNLVILLDRIEVDLQANLAAKELPVLGLEEFLKNWGISLPPVLVFDQSSLSLPVQRGSGADVEQFFVPYPPWVRIRGAGFNREHPITQGLTFKDLFWASPLTLHSTDRVRTTVLAYSGPRSWLVGEPYPTDPFTAPASLHRAIDRRGHYPLAVLAEKDRGKLIVVGDGQSVGGLVASTGSFENYSFLINAVEWLMDPTGAIEIRNRSLREYALFIEEGQRQFITELFVVYFIVLPILALVGVLWLMIWKKRNR